jgi:hypothetical protein
MVTITGEVSHSRNWERRSTRKSLIGQLETMHWQAR